VHVRQRKIQTIFAFLVQITVNCAHQQLTAANAYFPIILALIISAILHAQMALTPILPLIPAIPAPKDVLLALPSFFAKVASQSTFYNPIPQHIPVLLSVIPACWVGELSAGALTLMAVLK
jgi:hypothetical protein